LSRAEAEFSLCQVLLPKLTYPLIATNLTESQCSAILQPALIKAFLSMGINHHFPRAVAHGPRSHHGLDIPNLFTKQLIVHVLTLLRFGWQKDDPTSADKYGGVLLGSGAVWTTVWHATYNPTMYDLFMVCTNMAILQNA